MAPSLALPEPGPLLDAVTKEEANLRRSYLRVDIGRNVTDDPPLQSLKCWSARGCP